MTLEVWVNENRKLGNSVTCLETGDKSGIYQVSPSYSVGGGVTVNVYPRYYIWSNDKMVRVTSDYNEAYVVWGEVKAQHPVPA